MSGWQPNLPAALILLAFLPCLVIAARSKALDEDDMP